MSHILGYRSLTEAQEAFEQGLISSEEMELIKEYFKALEEVKGGD